MTLSKLLLNIGFILLTLQTLSQHSISVINNSNYNFNTTVEQTGSTILDTSQWWASTEDIYHWQADTIMLTVKDSIIFVGDTVEFKITFDYGTDTIEIKQRIVNSGGTKNVAYKVSGSSFSHPWVTDNNFHEAHITIDTAQVLIKYKIDRRAGTDLLLAIHTKHIYTIEEVDFSVPNVLNVFSYNIQFLPLVTENTEEKATSVAQYISPYQDVVIFQEVFIDSVRINYLTPSMEADGFSYNSGILNDPALPWINKSTNGGVIIYSKWPIEATAEHEYSTCAPGSADCFAAKGVKYAKVIKLGKAYHVFGTHMQAGNNHPEKQDQFGEVRDFIDSLNIPNTEPVIFGGDMNVHPNSGMNNYSAIRDSIMPIIPHPVGYHTSSFKRSNDKIGKIIDHVWASRFHLAPAKSNNAIVSIRGINDEMWNIFDWSGHRTATGRFEYPGPLQAKFDGYLCQEDSLTLKVNPLQNVSYTWFKNGQQINTQNNEIVFNNPTIADEGVYTCEASYTIIYGNTTDSLIQALYPDGADTVGTTVLFELADITFSEICGVGVSSNNNKPNIKIYPTISDGKFLVEGLDNTEIELRIYNSIGQLVKKQNIPNSKSTINLSNFESGLYIINYNRGDKQYSFKVIIK